MSEDLAEHHRQITHLFEWPTKASEWNRYRLTGEQIDFYRSNGYLAGVQILSEHQVGTVRAALPSILDADSQTRSLFYEYNSNESTDPAKVLFHALGAWRVSAAFHDLLWNPAFLAPASQLLGGPVRFWHDQIFHKPAYDGGVVAWHQDYSYWTRTKPMAHLSCWIGLDDSTQENGCVHYVPRSHNWDLLPVTGLAKRMDSIDDVLTPQQKADFNPVPIELKKGHASFHHPLMVHGSFENRTQKPRCGVVINVFRDGVLSDSDAPPLDGVPAIAKGAKMTGKFFPLLYDPDHP